MDSILHHSHVALSVKLAPVSTIAHCREPPHLVPAVRHTPIDLLRSACLRFSGWATPRIIAAAAGAAGRSGWSPTAPSRTAHGSTAAAPPAPTAARRARAHPSTVARARIWACECLPPRPPAGGGGGEPVPGRRPAHTRPCQRSSVREIFISTEPPAPPSTAAAQSVRGGWCRRWGRGARIVDM
jgi:hypothetical protein